jgi:hypothetical protein
VFLLTVVLRDAPLLTGDRAIRQNYASAAWD